MAPTCQLNCETLGSSCVNRTTRNPGCYCKTGYVLNCKNECVKASDYCKMCPVNSFYTECGIVPEKSCDIYDLANTSIAAGCVCKMGYIRDYDKDCIIPSDCPSKLI